MGRAREYRQRLKYQVASARVKTLENLLSARFRHELGLSPVEADLLGQQVSQWVLSDPGARGPNQIYLEAAAGRDSFSRRHKQNRRIKLTPFSSSDLETELEFGLAAMQLGRLLGLIEEAYRQDALLGTRDLVLLCHITPTSIRRRLKALRQEGIWAPVRGLSRPDREKGGCFRSTRVLEAYLEGSDLVPVRRALGLSAPEFAEISTGFARVARAVLNGAGNFQDPEEAEWAALARDTDSEKLEALIEARLIAADPGDATGFFDELRREFNLSPVKERAIAQTAEELLGALGENRGDGEVLYWAVSGEEPAGKPLSACRLVPVTLSYLEPGDAPDPGGDRDGNRVCDLKVRKLLRFSRGAQQAGAYLTYADLSYLLGIHPGALSRLVKAHPGMKFPLRGSQCDIGRSVTHRREIVRLYLEMHTETEIAARTGHSYEAIEAYLQEFATIYTLKERGLSVPMMRRVTGRSPRLLRAYLDLIDEFDAPDYAFRFFHLERAFGNRPEPVKKNPGEERP